MQSRPPLRAPFPSPSRLVRALLPALLLGALAATSLWGCSGDDDPEPAGVYVLHSVTDQGALEVLANGESLITLQPGVLSGRQRLDPGNTTLAVRSPGALAALTQTNVNLTSGQTHLVALRGAVSQQTLSVVVVDAVPPEPLDPDNALVEVVNLLTTDIDLDLYIGTTQIASNPAMGAVTPFVEVPAAVTNVRVFNSGDDPQSDLPVGTVAIELEPEGAAMIILSEGAGGALAIEVLAVR